MANKEPRSKEEQVHLLLALRRRKDNPDGPILCFREVIRDQDTDFLRLAVRCKEVPGNWRVHKTVNPRSVDAASKTLMHKLIDDPTAARGLDSLWKTCLLQQKAKAGRDFLVDVDHPNSKTAVLVALDAMKVPIHLIKDTPSGGCHVVCGKFNINALSTIPHVEVHRDGYYYLTMIEVK